MSDLLLLETVPPNTDPPITLDFTIQDLKKSIIHTQRLSICLLGSSELVTLPSLYTIHNSVAAKVLATCLSLSDALCSFSLRQIAGRKAPSI